MFSSISKRSHLPRRIQAYSTSYIASFRAQSSLAEGNYYWTKSPWKDVHADDFTSYRWQVKHTVRNRTLERFLNSALPEKIPVSIHSHLNKIKTKQDFIVDALNATRLTPMAIALTPHVLSRIDWENPLDDPIRKQFLPLASAMLPDHEHLSLDSLKEQDDSPVPGLVHRYPGRALFLATSICPVYCRFCTRSYAVGADTETVTKKPQKPSRKRWEIIFQHIENDQSLKDVVVSGGDAYYLDPPELREIGERLLSIDHIRRVRFASKGLAVAPGRIVKGDDWTETLIDLSRQGRKQGKQVCLHTHINHPREITWVTKRAANYLFEHGVIVRNQSVLLRDVNDTGSTLKELIETLADINIQPYYVYQCDMVRGVEDLRTPLSTIIELDKWCRGQLSGFMMPAFVIDLPGGGGKRLVSTMESYKDGVATYKAPGLREGKGGDRLYTYHDPKPIVEEELATLGQHKAQALQTGTTLEEVVNSIGEPNPLRVLDASGNSLQKASFKTTAESRAPSLLASQGYIGHEPAPTSAFSRVLAEHFRNTSRTRPESAALISTEDPEHSSLHRSAQEAMSTSSDRANA